MTKISIGPMTIMKENHYLDTGLLSEIRDKQVKFWKIAGDDREGRYKTHLLCGEIY